MRSDGSRRRSSSVGAATTETRRRATTLAVALTLSLAACGDGNSGDGTITPPPPPPPPPPPVTVVDSTAPATLQVQDSMRFDGLSQWLEPTARLLDLRGQPLPTTAVTWRSESDSVVRVVMGGVPRFVSQAPGTTRIIATLTRPGAEPLVDTIQIVVRPILVALVVGGTSGSLLEGEETVLAVSSRDVTGNVRALPDSLRARVVWRSLAPTIATVDADGRVRGIAQGSAPVEASLATLGLRDSVTVAVARRYDLASADVYATGRINPGLMSFAATPDGSNLFTIENGIRNDQTLAAITPAGVVRWQRRIGSSSRQLTAGREGSSYFLDGNLLRGYHRDGDELYPLGLPCEAYAVDASATIYCTRADSLVAYSPAGSVLWNRAAPGAREVVVGGRDAVYAYGRGLTAFSRDGSPRWAYDVGGAQIFVGAVDAEGAVYFNAQDNSLSALGPDGRLRWKVPDVRGAMAIAPGGTLLIAENGRRMLSALRTADGVGRWRVFNDAMGSGGLPHVADDGRVYVAGACEVHVWELASGTVLGRTAARVCPNSGGTAFVPRRLYFASFGGIRSVDIPAAPGSEWSQLYGNAGKTRGPEQR